VGAYHLSGTGTITFWKAFAIAGCTLDRATVSGRKGRRYYGALAKQTSAEIENSQLGFVLCPLLVHGATSLLHCSTPLLSLAQWVMLGLKNVTFGTVNTCTYFCVCQVHCVKKWSSDLEWSFVHCVSKKQDTKLLPITSLNVNRFSKFFH